MFGDDEVLHVPDPEGVLRHGLATLLKNAGVDPNTRLATDSEVEAYARGVLMGEADLEILYGGELPRVDDDPAGPPAGEFSEAPSLVAPSGDEPPEREGAEDAPEREGAQETPPRVPKPGADLSGVHAKLQRYYLGEFGSLNDPQVAAAVDALEAQLEQAEPTINIGDPNVQLDLGPARGW